MKLRLRFVVAIMLLILLFQPFYARGQDTDKAIMTLKVADGIFGEKLIEAVENVVKLGKERHIWEGSLVKRKVVIDERDVYILGLNSKYNSQDVVIVTGENYDNFYIDPTDRYHIIAVKSHKWSFGESYLVNESDDDFIKHARNFRTLLKKEIETNK